MNTFQDVTALKRLDARLQLLADAGTILARSGDYQETLNELAQLMVRQLADWCIVDVLEVETGVSRVAVAHARKEKVLFAAELQRRYPTDPSEGAAATVMRTGVPLLLPVITDAQLDDAARDAEHAAGLRALGLRSVLIVPLAARGTTLGALTLIRSDARRPFSERDVPLAEEVARRAGAAVDAARLLHEATEAVRLRDDFLAMASHDMRTPLAVILGYIQLAARRMKRVPIEDAKLSGYLASAERTTGRLNSLVGELMDVSLLRSGRALPLNPERLRLRSLVETIVAEHRRLTAERTFEVVATGDPIIEADGDRLERVMDNLIENAVKYSGEGSRIQVAVDVHDGEATISVADLGRGIPAADLPHIFEPFHRAANASGIRGTGGWGWPARGTSSARWAGRSRSPAKRARGPPSSSTSPSRRNHPRRTDRRAAIMAAPYSRPRRGRDPVILRRALRLSAGAHRRRGCSPRARERPARRRPAVPPVRWPTRPTRLSSVPRTSSSARPASRRLLGRPSPSSSPNEEAVPHDVAVYTDNTKSEELVRGDIITGPNATTTVTVPAQQPGQLFFQCTIHAAMQGALVVEAAGIPSSAPASTSAY